MKNYYDYKQNCWLALDGEHEFDSGWIDKRLKSWKTQYFRKNSRKSARIGLRCSFFESDPDFWKYFVEVVVDGKVKEQDRVKKEAYELHAAGIEPEQLCVGLEIVTLASFKPIQIIKS